MTPADQKRDQPRQSGADSRLGVFLYQHIPMLRSAMASAWGYRLRRLRYGGNSDQLAQEALGREKWPAAQWQSYQEEQLAKILDRAARKVPYYKDMWSKRRAAGDHRPTDRLENWPILEKEAIRHDPLAFLDEDYPAGSLHKQTTSGTTGNPIHIWYTAKTVRDWYAIGEARWRYWCGVTRHDRWALLGAQMVAPIAQKKPPYWVWNRGLNQLYMSTYHMSNETIHSYLDAIRDHGIQYLSGHSSALHSLARAAIEAGRKDLRMKVVLSSSEPLTKVQRAAMTEAFQTGVRETYGMTEMAAAASECEHGHLHFWPEIGCMELVNGMEPAAPGEVAELISTTFLHEAMPLIRYRIGDLVQMEDQAARCACGRTLPLVKAVVGRNSDMLYTPDGRQLTPSSMEVVFDTDVHLLEAQIVQLALDRVQLIYVPAPGFCDRDAQLLRSRILERMGNVDLTLHQVPQIERGPNGKFKAVVNRLSASDMAAAARR